MQGLGGERVVYLVFKGSAATVAYFDEKIQKCSHEKSEQVWLAFHSNWQGNHLFALPVIPANKQFFQLHPNKQQTAEGQANQQFVEGE
jgi:hypothetical protein